MLLLFYPEYHWPQRQVFLIYVSSGKSITASIVKCLGFYDFMINSDEKSVSRLDCGTRQKDLATRLFYLC